MKILLTKRKGNRKIYGYSSGCGLSAGALLTIGGGALSLGGTVANMVANNNARQAMSNAANAEMQRQQNFRDQGRAEVAKRISLSAQPVAEQAIADGASKAQGMYNVVNNVPLTASMGNNFVADSAINGDAASARTSLFNRVAAPIQGLSEWQTAEAINNLKSQAAINTLQNFARGSAAILPVELSAAQHSQDNLRAVGSAMSGVGSLLGVAGALTPANTLASGSSLTLASGRTPWWGSPALKAAGIPGGWTDLPVTGLNLARTKPLLTLGY